MSKYPKTKNCIICGAAFQVADAKKARRKTCGLECRKKALWIDRDQTPKPPEQRKMTLISCPVCGVEVWKPDAWLKKVAKPTCSNHCNGKLRGVEWRKHAHKGRANWTDEQNQACADRWRGEKNPSWKGGVTYRNRKGLYRHQSIKYVRCPVKFSAMARRDGYVMEHRLKVARTIGRPLTRVEVVHHINHNATDNRIENLMLFATNGEHKSFEHGRDVKPLWSGSPT